MHADGRIEGDLDRRIDVVMSAFGALKRNVHLKAES